MPLDAKDLRRNPLFFVFGSVGGSVGEYRGNAGRMSDAVFVALRCGRRYWWNGVSFRRGMTLPFLSVNRAHHFSHGDIRLVDPALSVRGQAV